MQTLSTKESSLLGKMSSRFGKGSRARTGLWLTLPALLVIAATVFYPIGWAFKISLFSSEGMMRNSSFVGFENYLKVLSSPAFLSALGHTFAFVVSTLVIELLIGFTAALILNQMIPGSKWFRLLFTLPLMMAPVVSGLQWRWLFADQYGVINHILKIFGVDGPLWLATAWGARAAVLIANVWLAAPFVILVLLAGLSSLSEELYEAARLDGAKSHQLFRFITLPLLRPALLMILVIRLTDSIRVFDIVYIMTQGGPGGSTEVLSSYIYKQTFSNLHFGQGTAAAFIIMVIIIIISYVCFRFLRPKDGEV